MKALRPCCGPTAAAQFNQLSIHLLTEEIIQISADASIVDAVNDHWNINSTSDNKLQLEIKSFRFTIHEDDVMQIQVKAMMDVVTETIDGSLIFTYEGPKQSIDYWLQDDGANILLEMDLAIAKVSESMVTMLRLGNR